MVSKILIDIDTNRNAVVKVSGVRLAAESDDVKDKLVRQFIEDVSYRGQGLAAIHRDSENDAILKPAALDVMMFAVLAALGGDGTESGKKMRELIAMEFGGPSDASVGKLD